VGDGSFLQGLKIRLESRFGEDISRAPVLYAMIADVLLFAPTGRSNTRFTALQIRQNRRGMAFTNSKVQIKLYRAMHARSLAGARLDSDGSPPK